MFTMKTVSLASLAIISIGFGSATAWAVPAPLSTPYTQDFNSLGDSGTSLSGINEWSVYRFTTAGWGGPTWTNSTGIPTADVSGGALMDDSVSGTNLGLFYNGSFPTFTRQGGVNAGLSTDPADPNRSLGTSPSGFAGNAIQLDLTNDTGTPISVVNVSYKTNVLTSGVGTNELPGYRFFYSLTGVAGTWFDVPALDTVTSSSDAAFTTYSTSAALTLSSPLAAGESLLLRWVDDNATETSPDQMISIDDVSVSVPEPTSLGLLVLGSAAMLRRERRHA